jgi:hypothetical protein
MKNIFKGHMMRREGDKSFDDHVNQERISASVDRKSDSLTTRFEEKVIENCQRCPVFTYSP